jgi:hypothetical protein
VPDGGDFDYTVTLDNEAGSDGSITTFWYAWDESSGYNFMYSDPSNVQSPGWTPTVTGGGYTYTYSGYSYDGWGIEFIATGGGLAPGQSTTFAFSSPDSPAMMAGESYWHPGYLVDSAYVYSTGSGSSSSFDVVSVPEPSVLALSGVGMAGFLALRSRSRRLAR